MGEVHRLLRTLSAASIRIRAHGPLYEVPVPLVVYIDLLRLNCMKKQLGKYTLDTQDPSSYTLTAKKQCLINRAARDRLVCDLRIAGRENTQAIIEPWDEIFDRFEIIK